jgi:hypothetical protein
MVCIPCHMRYCLQRQLSPNPAPWPPPPQPPSPLHQLQILLCYLRAFVLQRLLLVMKGLASHLSALAPPATIVTVRAPTVVVMRLVAWAVGLHCCVCVSMSIERRVWSEWGSLAGEYHVLGYRRRTSSALRWGLGCSYPLSP